MRWIIGIYLIVGAVVCWLWADGPLYTIGVTIGGRDFMGYVIPVIFIANLVVGVGLLVVSDDVRPEERTKRMSRWHGGPG